MVGSETWTRKILLVRNINNSLLLTKHTKDKWQIDITAIKIQIARIDQKKLVCKNLMLDNNKIKDLKMPLNDHA